MKVTICSDGGDVYEILTRHDGVWRDSVGEVVAVDDDSALGPAMPVINSRVWTVSDVIDAGIAWEAQYDPHRL